MSRDLPLRLVWKSFELRPGGGMPDAAKLAMIRAYHPRLRATAAALGVPMGAEPPRMGIDTRPVHEAAKFITAHRPEREKHFHDAVYRAHFVDGKNLGERATLLALGAAVGAEPSELAAALDRGDHRDAVIADEREAQARRVTGVPGLWLGDRPLAVGYMPPAQLKQALAQALGQP